MGQPSRPIASHQPDLAVLFFLGVIQQICLVAIALIAGMILAAWLVPFLHPLLPISWNVMKANTGALLLLCGLSIYLNQPLRSARSITASRLVGLFVSLFAAATLGEYIFRISLGLDNIIAVDPVQSLPGRMSVQTAVSFLLLGFVLLNLRARKGLLASLVDGLVLCLALLMLVFIAGYAYGALGLFGLSMQHRLSSQTLICFVLLTFLVFNRRTEYGVFSIMIDDGIGGKTARMAAPCAVLLPFVLAGIRGLVTRYKLVPEQYAIAMAAALLALISFCFIIFLSARCRLLESDIRELSIRDELTRLYNRRGFYLLAEQGLRLARRERESFFLIFIDMDNLKPINDTLGHEVGSELLQEVAALLQTTFREVDVVGRLGGDEFVIAGKGGQDEILVALARLESAANHCNDMPSRKYPLNFSLGYVTSNCDNAETLVDLVQQADAIMYEAKRNKKHAHAHADESMSLAV